MRFIAFCALFFGLLYLGLSLSIVEVSGTASFHVTAFIVGTSLGALLGIVSKGFEYTLKFAENTKTQVEGGVAVVYN